MTRFLVLSTLVASVFSCQPNTAEIRCGRSACASNQRCDGAHDVCVLDEPPTLIIDAPRAGELIAGTALKVQGTVADDNGAATVELSTDGITWSAIAVRGKSFATELALESQDGAELRIRVRAHDGHQQATQTEVPVRIDNVAPAVNLALADGAVLNAAWFANGGRVEGTATDGSGLASLTMDLGDGPLTQVSPFAQPWAAPVGDDGVRHTVRVVAIDPAGNRTEREVQVTVDVVAPALTFDAPADDDILGPAFFAAGGVVRGTMAKGARVATDFGSGKVQVGDARWSTQYPAQALDFVPRTLSVTATDDAGNVTRIEHTVVVDVVPPRLAFTGALNGAKLNAAQFTQGDDVVADWQVTDGDAQTAVRSGGAFAVHPLRVTTSPTDNPKSYAVELTAEDRAGNQATAQLGFSVDRVAPTVTVRYPADGTRNAELSTALEFSEPMLGASGLVLAPASGTGTWQTPVRYVVHNLAEDTVYAQTAGTVTDEYGNPVAAVPPLRFHTRIKFAPNGSVLMNDVWKFEAAVDDDGVISFFTTSTTIPAAYHWARVHPKTGLVEENKTPWQPTAGVSLSNIGVYATSTPNADLTAHRVGAATTTTQAVIADRRAWVRLDDGAATSTMGMVGVVPARNLAGEGAGLGELGFLKYLSATTASYTRAGLAADVSTELMPTGIAVAPNRWEVVEASGSTLKRRSFSCAPAIGGLPAACGFGPIAQWTNVASPATASFAINAACSVYSYDAPNGDRLLRIEPYADSCPNKQCPAGWSMTFDPMSDVRLAPAEGGKFLVAERVATGVRVRSLDLGPACNWPIFGTDSLVPVPAGAPYRLVSAGYTRALLYVDASNALRVQYL